MRHSKTLLLAALLLSIASLPVSAQQTPPLDPELDRSPNEPSSHPIAPRQFRPQTGAGRSLTSNPMAGARRSRDLPPALNRAPVVGMITGEIDGTFLQFGSDVSEVVSSDALRVMPLMGRGSVQNLGDLLYFRGVDLALLAADSVRAAEASKSYPGFRSRVIYLTKLYDEEVHVVAGADVHALADLAGKIVSVGAVGSGTSVTGPAIFEATKIAIKPEYETSDVALEKLKRGEIAAMVYLGGKPSQLLTTIPPNSGLHLLPLPTSETLMDTYIPATLTHADYPTLTAEGELVETLAVPVLLTAYNWPVGSPQYKNLAAFTDTFFSHLPDFLKAPYHEKWRDVNLRARVPGWTRASYAQQWLDRADAGAAASPITVAAGFDQEEFSEWANSIGLTKLTGVQKDELFRLWKLRRSQP